MNENLLIFKKSFKDDFIQDLPSATANIIHLLAKYVFSLAAAIVMTKANISIAYTYNAQLPINSILFGIAKFTIKKNDKQSQYKFLFIHLIEYLFELYKNFI